jgi:hypothetical protein
MTPALLSCKALVVILDQARAAERRKFFDHFSQAAVFHIPAP